MRDGNHQGSFLVRNSASVHNKFCLSIRYHTKVLHYLIYQPEGSEDYCIHYTITFKSIQELVKYYHTHSEGICTNLKQPCQLAVKPKRELQHDRWDVKHSTVQLAEKIGTGFFCETYKGVWNGTIQVAVRTPRYGFPVTTFMEEAAIMKRLSHPNILQLHATCLSKEPLYIITEHMKYGTLCEYLHKQKQFLATKFPGLIYDISAQVARGMAHMEEWRCIHRNLSSNSVLVGDNLVCKVASFSCAKRLEPGCEIYEAPSTDKFKPTARMLAPESLTRQEFSIKSDMWSFAILLYEMATFGQIPYPDLSDTEVLRLLRHDVQGLHLSCPSDCPAAIYEIMLECRKGDPSR